MVRENFGEDILSEVTMSVEYSKYYEELQEEPARGGYEQKLKTWRCLKDPYCYLESKRSIHNAFEWTEWPDVTFVKVYDCLVLTVRLYTRDQLKVD